METAAILFRDHAKGDKYKDLLVNDHCAVESIPVLEHKYLLDAQSIKAVVDDASSEGLAGLVFTSGNAVRALARAVDAYLSEAADENDDSRERWRRILRLPIFVVGKETMDACTSLLFSAARAANGGTRETEDDVMDIRGSECGCASEMVTNIIDFSRQQQSRKQGDGKKPRVLFFCGNQRRSAIPDGIRESGAAELVEMVAYTTVGRNTHDTRRDLIATVDRIVAKCRRNAPAAAVLIWMVVFSPSGVRVVAPLLEDLAHAREPPLVPASTLAAVYKRHAATKTDDVFYGYAAIGKTTMTELASRAGADTMLTTQADTPNAVGICNAIRNKMSFPGVL
ncbi:uroporphyrinogen-III synthase [Coemansia sp. RSA 1285]|nr:uroporphyrinogen-III synthase [Coemansia sp. RSA 1804]KAJ2688829.1 uroporphyrinogen-III synthase [Coemansia sp. RSA 1285]